MKAALGIVTVLLLFTICKSWIFDSDALLKKVDFGDSESSEPAEDFRRFPYSNVRSERCDACRIIARRFDNALGDADSAIQGPTSYDDFADWKKEEALEMRELEPAAVADVVERVCATETFADVTPVWDKKPDTETVGEDSVIAERLTADGAEMWEEWRRGGIRFRKSDANWAQRMANHCRYLSTEKLQGAEIYDMWLRVSAGVGGDPFEHFLCLGEGVFADCITERDGSTWPAGDSAPEDDEYDEFARGDDEDADIEDESAAIWTEPEGATADLHTI